MKEGELLWQPTELERAASRMSDYLGFLARTRGLHFDDYPSVYAWSVTELAEFWLSIAEYFGVQFTKHADPGPSGGLPHAHWFAGATLNYAEHALRERGEDVETLAVHFLNELNAQAQTQKRLSALARMTLKQHSWPGNVRELKNCIERAFIMSDGVLELAPLIQNTALRSPESASAPRGGEFPADRERLDIRVGSRIDDVERSLIEATLDYFKGNKRRAADALGCSLKTLYNKLNVYSQSQECANS